MDSDLCFIVGFDASQKYPLAVVIHGGPQGSFKDGWMVRWNLQLYAAQGYAVLAVNFHGSNSFGHKFCASISKGLLRISSFLHTLL